MFNMNSKKEQMIQQLLNLAKPENHVKIRQDRIYKYELGKTLKIGDKLICTDVHGDNDEDLIIGNTYEVESIDLPKGDEFLIVFIQIKDKKGWYPLRWFDKLK